MEKFDYVIVGSGLFGAVFAHQMNANGKRCLVLDRRQQKGGNVYCENIGGIWDSLENLEITLKTCK